MRRAEPGAAISSTKCLQPATNSAVQFFIRVLHGRPCGIWQGQAPTTCLYQVFFLDVTLSYLFCTFCVKDAVPAAALRAPDFPHLAACNLASPTTVFHSLLVSSASTGGVHSPIMTTTTHIPGSDADTFDYIIVGGGTAGCVVASRLAEYLPHKKVLLIEAGPSDFKNDDVLLLKNWLNLLDSEYDYGYKTTEQPMGRL